MNILLLKLRKSYTLFCEKKTLMFHILKIIISQNHTSFQI